MEWHPAGLLVHLPLLSSHCTRKPRRWHAKIFGAKGKRYPLFWRGGKERSDSVEIFVAEKWEDSTVNADTE